MCRKDGLGLSASMEGSGYGEHSTDQGMSIEERNHVDERMTTWSCWRIMGAKIMGGLICQLRGCCWI